MAVDSSQTSEGVSERSAGSSEGLLIGATGLLGRAMLTQLERHNLHFDIFARTPSKLARRAQQGLIFTGELEDSAALAEAMRGKKWVIFIPTNTQDKVAHAANVALAAQTAGVSLIVKISAILAREDPPESFGIEHFAAESIIKDSGREWIIVRPPFFMQTFEMFAHVMRNQNKIILPVGHGRTAFIDAHDIGACVARCIENQHEYVGRILTVTGPKAINMTEVANLFSEASGKPIKFVSPPGFITGLILRWVEKQDPWTVKRMLQLFRAIRKNKESEVTLTVEEILGRPAGSFSDFLERDRDAQRLWAEKAT